jgi:hypothetical protein
VGVGAVSGGAVLGHGGAPSSGGEGCSAVVRTDGEGERDSLCGDGCSEACGEEAWLRAAALGWASWDGDGDGGGGSGGGCPCCCGWAHESRNDSGCLLDGTAQTSRAALPLPLREGACDAACCGASARGASATAWPCWAAVGCWAVGRRGGPAVDGRVGRCGGVARLPVD